MSRNRLPPISSLPPGELDAVEREILVRARIAEIKKSRSFDSSLGSTREEAEANLEAMQNDIGRYGKYVFDWEPQPFHTLWNQAAEDVIQRRVPHNKLLIIAPPNSAKSSWNSIVRPCFYLGQHPDHNLIFATASDDMAGNFGQDGQGDPRRERAAQDRVPGQSGLAR